MLGSFADILEEMNLKNGGSPSEQAPFVDTDPAHLSYLLGQRPIFNCQSEIRKNPYLRDKIAKRVSIRPPHSLTDLQKQAYFALEKFGAEIHPAFTEPELKKIYRVLALKIHPDINPSPSAQEDFHLLKTSVECLSQIFKS